MSKYTVLVVTYLGLHYLVLTSVVHSSLLLWRVSIPDEDSLPETTLPDTYKITSTLYLKLKEVLHMLYMS